MIEFDSSLGQREPRPEGDPLAALWDRRFRELPIDCGRHLNPGIVDVDAWRDWSRFETTPDQLRIEDYLDRFDLRDKSILHIGMGNSGLASRFAKRARRIVGTTVVESELREARVLGLPNYSTVLHNKHSGDDPSISGRFDFIVDNNPTTFCCCLTHLDVMLGFYAARLAPGGQIVTDRVGLGWTTNAPGAIARWGFSFEDLAACAELHGLEAFRIDQNIYVLARQKPPRPNLSGNIAHAVRSFRHRLWRKVCQILNRKRR